MLVGLYTIVLALAPCAVTASCKANTPMGDLDCSWAGAWSCRAPLTYWFSPGAGTLGGRRFVLTSTKDNSKDDLCASRSDKTNPGQDCCNDYGTRCRAGGYKDLWCLMNK